MMMPAPIPSSAAATAAGVDAPRLRLQVDELQAELAAAQQLLARHKARLVAAQVGAFPYRGFVECKAGVVHPGGKAPE